MSQRIAFVNAGWTIGMRMDANGVLHPPKSSNAFRTATGALLDDFQKRFWATVDFHFFDTMDSSDRTIESIYELHMCIAKLLAKYDSVVIGHGTDTLTAASGLSSLLFCNPNNPWSTSQTWPVVFTASQKSLVFKEWDAVGNLFHALETAYKLGQKSLNTTVITFLHSILNASRTMKQHDHHFDAFSSPGAQPLGNISALWVEIFDHVQPIPFKRNNDKPVIPWINASLITINTAMRTGDIINMASPGKHPFSVIRTLWEGNIPWRLLPDIDTLVQRGHIPILATSFPGGGVGGWHYELWAKALKLGAVSAGNMTPDMALLKAIWLWWNKIHDKKEFTRMLQTSYVGEVTEPDKKSK